MKAKENTTRSLGILIFIVSASSILFGIVYGLFAPTVYGWMLDLFTILPLETDKVKIVFRIALAIGLLIILAMVIGIMIYIIMREGVYFSVYRKRKILNWIPLYSLVFIAVSVYFANPHFMEIFVAGNGFVFLFFVIFNLGAIVMLYILTSSMEYEWDYCSNCNQWFKKIRTVYIGNLQGTNIKKLISNGADFDKYILEKIDTKKTYYKVVETTCKNCGSVRYFEVFKNIKNHSNDSWRLESQFVEKVEGENIKKEDNTD